MTPKLFIPLVTWQDCAAKHHAQIGECVNQGPAMPGSVRYLKRKAP